MKDAQCGHLFIIMRIITIFVDNITIVVYNPY